MLRAAAATTAGFLPPRLAAETAPAARVVAAAGAEVRSSPLLRALGVPRGGAGIGSATPGRRMYFASGSDSSGSAADSDSEASSAAGAGEEESEGNRSSSAVAPAIIRPEDCHTVRSLSLAKNLISIVLFWCLFGLFAKEFVGFELSLSLEVA